MNRISRPLTLIALACGAGAVQAGTGLGLDSGVGLLSFDDVRLSGGSINGNVLVGGDATISGMSIRGSGNSLLVGGNVDFNSGSVSGNSVIGGQLTSSYGGIFGGNLAVGGGLNAKDGLSVAGSTTAWGSITGMQPWYPAVTPGSGSFALGFDFGAEKSRFTALSAQLDQQSTTGSAQLQWSTLHFDATGQSLAVFDIDAADASKNMRIDGLANGAAVVINVHGSAVDFGNHGYDNFGNGQVLFNLVDAKSITLGSLQASLLAPQATVQPGWGSVTGQVVVDNWLGGSIDSVAFNGTLPSITAAVPEPGTGLMLLAGLGAVGLIARRRFGKTSLRLTPVRLGK